MAYGKGYNAKEHRRVLGNLRQQTIRQNELAKGSLDSNGANGEEKTVSGCFGVCSIHEICRHAEGSGGAATVVTTPLNETYVRADITLIHPNIDGAIELSAVGKPETPFFPKPRVNEVFEYLGCGFGNRK